MSICGTIVQKVTWLERQSQILVQKVCQVEALKECADWDDKGSAKCTKTRDDGYSRCDKSRDDGYSECCDWWPCSWFCDAVVWVSHIVCTAWTWVSHIVCQVWKWVSKWVCRVVHWIYKTICLFITSVVFWFIRRVLLWVILLPCRFHEPKLDSRIKHIFVLVLENRSFDHMLGATPIAGTCAATNEPTKTRCRPDDATNDVVDGDGNVTATCKAGVGQRRAVSRDPGHEFGNTRVALCGLKASETYPPYPKVDNSGFAQNFVDNKNDPCSVMLSYRMDDDEDGTADVPVIAALAREFAICDHWFSSMPGPTWPNRLFLHAASSAGLDDSPLNGDLGLEELIGGMAFDNGNIFDLLDSENIEWAVYHDDALPQVMSLSGMDLGIITTNFNDMDDFEEDLADGSMANYVFLEPDYGDLLSDKRYKCGNSQHPYDDITHGERLIKRVYEAIRNSSLWDKSMLIITYDEGGGFYDHVHPPATVHPGDSVVDSVSNHHDFAFTQLGVRVPAIICSPWIPRNVIDHRLYEHASVPRVVERLWDLPSMTERDAHAGDLTRLLTLSRPRTDAPTRLPDAAAAEQRCPDDPRALRASSAPLTERPAKATLLGPAPLALAQEANPKAITSTAAAFLQVAVRRDLLLAPENERPKIVAQARRLLTMGEVDLYVQAVVAEVERHERLQSQREVATGRPPVDRKARERRRPRMRPTPRRR